MARFDDQTYQGNIMRHKTFKPQNLTEAYMVVIRYRNMRKPMCRADISYCISRDGDSRMHPMITATKHIKSESYSVSIVYILCIMRQDLWLECQMSHVISVVCLELTEAYIVVISYWNMREPMCRADIS